MFSGFRVLLCAVSFSLLAVNGASDASTVTFDDTSPTVGLGDMFELEIIGNDFAELAGGTIDLQYDDGVVEINNVTVNTDIFDFDPDSGSKTMSGPPTAQWTGIGFDTFVNDPASGSNILIATVSLTALAVGSSELTILESSEFFSATQELFPDLVNAEIQVIPIPAAAYLFGSGLLVLVGIARKRKTA